MPHDEPQTYELELTRTIELVVTKTITVETTDEWLEDNVWEEHPEVLGLAEGASRGKRGQFVLMFYECPAFLAEHS